MTMKKPICNPTKHPGMPQTPVAKTVVVNQDGKGKVKRHLRRVTMKPPYIASEDVPGGADSGGGYGNW
jgi:hypothetical protein